MNTTAPADSHQPLIRWLDDGTPMSPRFGDIYRNAADGGLLQAERVFLAGCGLLESGGQPARWHDAPRWAVLETGFGLGLNFLATWLAWQHAPHRPRRLFYSAVEAFPPDPAELLRSAAPYPQLQPLALQLAARWRHLLPGVHRLCFEQGQLMLTLAIGDVHEALWELSGRHDSIYLDGFSPARNPDMWDLRTMKAVARLARRGTGVATWCVAADIRARLAQCGFQVRRVSGLPPKRHALAGIYQPAWKVRTRTDAGLVRAAAPGRCAIVGGGLAGAAAADSLARRGWDVSVFDGAALPAAGASAVPAGLIAPHVSADDNLLSRFTRAGVSATLQRTRDLLREGEDYAVSGVLQLHAPDQFRLPPGWLDPALPMAQRSTALPDEDPLTRQRVAEAGVTLDRSRAATWHQQAGWIHPAALVRALLAQPGITWHGGRQVMALRTDVEGWTLELSGTGPQQGFDLVVLAAGHATARLAPAVLPLQALRGQIAHGHTVPTGFVAPPFPVSGNGIFMAHADTVAGWWQAGASFQRDSADTRTTDAEHASNRTRLQELLPAVAQTLAACWDEPATTRWAGIRATLPDHLPAVGALPSLPGTMSSATAGLLPLHACTGLGARGLAFAILCGEILAATLHDEPLPVARKLLQRVRADRFARRRR